MDSLQGSLLIATPQLRDSPFSRTVVLLIQHDENGAVGIVLNRTINETVSNLWKHVSGEPCEVDLPVNMGGPVSGPLMALHCVKPLCELETPAGIYVASSRECLQKLVHQSKSPFRVYVGHAGWGGGQLEQELSNGYWYTAPARPDHVFGKHEDLWRLAMREVGESFLRDILRIHRWPEQACWN